MYVFVFLWFRVQKTRMYVVVLISKNTKVCCFDVCTYKVRVMSHTNAHDMFVLKGKKQCIVSREIQSHTFKCSHHFFINLFFFVIFLCQYYLKKNILFFLLFYFLYIFFDFILLIFFFSNLLLLFLLFYFIEFKSSQAQLQVKAVFVEGFERLSEEGCKKSMI